MKQFISLLVEFDRTWTACNKHPFTMAKHDKDPPILRGFTSSGTGRGKALTSPTTSLWLAIIFVAIFFAMMSVQRTINKATEAANPKDTHRSGWIIDAPEQAFDRDPPPNPDFVLGRQEDLPIVLEEEIEMKEEPTPIEIKPIEIELEVSMPDELRSAENNSN